MEVMGKYVSFMLVYEVIFLLLVQAENMNNERIQSEIKEFLIEMENEQQQFQDFKAGLLELDHLKQTIELSPVDKNKLMDLSTSAKIMANELVKKTDLVLGKIGALKQTDMFSICVSEGKCNKALPALEDINNHLQSRSASFQGTRVIMQDLEILFPSYVTIIKKQMKLLVIEAFIITLDLYKDTKSIIMNQLLTLLNDIKIIDPLIQMSIERAFDGLLLICICYYLASRKLIFTIFCLTFSILVVVICVTNSNITVYSQIQDVIHIKIANVKHLEMIETLQSRNLFKNVKKYFVMANAKQGMDFAFKKLEGDKEESKIDTETLSKYGHSIKSRLRNLVVYGGEEYKDLQFDMERAYEDFQEYVKSVVNTLTKTYEFYQKVTMLLESLIESKPVKILDVKMVTKEILGRTLNLEMEYEDHKQDFAHLQQRLDNIQIDISRFEKQNEKNKLASKVVTSAVMAIAVLWFPPAAAAATAAAAAGAGVYFNNEAENKNIVLRDVECINTEIKKLSLENLEILSNIDPSKIRSSMEAADKSLDGEEIDREQLNYYFGDALKMVRESMGETREAIITMKELYRYKG